MRMKKFLLFLVACIASVCAYANTCDFDGTSVSLRSEQAKVSNSGYMAKAMFTITVSDTNRKSIRIHVEVNGERQWVTVKLQNGVGYGEASVPLSTKNGTYVPIKLIQQPNMCY